MTMVHDMPSSNCEPNYLTSKIQETSSKIKLLLNHFIFTFIELSCLPLS